MSVQKEELYRLIEALPEKEIAAAKRFLEFLVIRPAEESWDEFSKNAPEDDEPLSEDDLRDIEEGKKAIAEGRVKSWEQVKSEYGL